MTNPVLTYLADLQDAGFSHNEAENIVLSLQAANENDLLAIAPKWVAHVCETRRYYYQLIDLAGQGLLKVSFDNGWKFELNEKGQAETAKKSDPDWLVNLDFEGATLSVRKLEAIYKTIPAADRHHPRATWLEGMIMGLKATKAPAKTKKPAAAKPARQMPKKPSTAKPKASK